MAANPSPNNKNIIGGSILGGVITLLGILAHLSDIGSFVLTACESKIIFCQSSPPAQEQKTPDVIKSENHKTSNTQQEKPPRFIKSLPPKTADKETEIRFIRATPKPTSNSR